jgi:hypothetical protein
MLGGMPPELYQARLFRMQFQPERSQPFPPLLQESLRYFPLLEPDDETIPAVGASNVPRNPRGPGLMFLGTAQK